MEESKEEKKNNNEPFNISKTQRSLLAQYVNEAILEKYPDTNPKILLKKENIMKNVCSDETAYPLSEVCAGFIKTIASKQSKRLSEKLWTPHIIIIEHETYSVIGHTKSLQEILDDSDFKEDLKVKVIIHQLYSKHKKLDLQVTQLLQAEKEKVLNVIFCTPNRLIKLGEIKALDFSELKYVILDCTKNEKGQTLFDYKETRNDTIELLEKYILEFAAKNKLKLYFH